MSLKEFLIVMTVVPLTISIPLFIWACKLGKAYDEPEAPEAPKPPTKPSPPRSYEELQRENDWFDNWWKQ